MNDLKKWTNEKKLQLIKLVQVEPHLWNRCLKDYREKKKVEVTWKAIAENFDGCSSMLL